MPELKLKRFTVDLAESPDVRWNELFSDKNVGRTALKLARKAEKTAGAPVILKKIASGIIQYISSQAGLDYAEDINAWAENVFTSDPDLVWCANMSYELNALCSSVAFKHPKLGMVHARNLDWNLSGMNDATMLIDFKNAEAGDFTAVTVPGYTGVLSGVAKGRFSATVNMNVFAESVGSWNLIKLGKNIKVLTTGWSAGWALRYMFETCQTYKSALQFLKGIEASRPFFVQLVGTNPGEAAVIEVNGAELNEVFKFKEKPLAITNHCISDGCEECESCDNYDECPDEANDSVERYNSIIYAAESCKSNTLAGIQKAILNNIPVLNGSTQQSMVLLPKTGKVYLERV